VVSGEGPFEALGWDGHLVLLHRTELDRRSGLAAWVRRGIERDEKILYAESEDESPQRSVLEVLRNQGIDVHAATAGGRMQVVPLPEFYPTGYRPMAERALADGFRAVRVSGEAEAVLRFLSEDAYAAVEGDVDGWCRTGRFSSLCQCSDAISHASWLPRTTALHARGIRELQLHTSESEDGLILAGHVDAANEGLLIDVLQAATRGADHMFRLDLRRVTFLGVSGAWALLVGIQRFREQGGRVLLTAPQPMVELALRATRVDLMPQVELTVAEVDDTTR
jgi:anti-anti-sigma factor